VRHHHHRPGIRRARQTGDDVLDIAAGVITLAGEFGEAGFDFRRQPEPGELAAHVIAYALVIRRSHRVRSLRDRFHVHQRAFRGKVRRHRRRRHGLQARGRRQRDGSPDRERSHEQPSRRRRRNRAHCLRLARFKANATSARDIRAVASRAHENSKSPRVLCTGGRIMMRNTRFSGALQ